jgi:hypothetical protein
MHVPFKETQPTYFCSLISEAKEVVKRIPGAVKRSSHKGRRANPIKVQKELLNA